MIKLIFFSISLGVFSFYSSYSQNIADSGIARQSVANAIALYNLRMRDVLPVYNGKEFINSFQSVSGFPYFESDAFSNGTVCYERQIFTQIPLLYDIVSEKVVTKHFNKPVNIELVNEEISYFIIHGHTFVKVLPDSSHTIIPVTSFYDQLYAGEGLKVLVKRSKSVQESNNNQRVRQFFQTSNNYFIIHDNKYYRVKSEASALKVFKNYQKQIKTELKNKRIKFRETPEIALVEMAKLYIKLMQK